MIGPLETMLSQLYIYSKWSNFVHPNSKKFRINMVIFKANWGGKVIKGKLSGSSLEKVSGI